MVGMTTPEICKVQTHYGALLAQAQQQAAVDRWLATRRRSHS
jgi:hypothetical protein